MYVARLRRSIGNHLRLFRTLATLYLGIGSTGVHAQTAFLDDAQRRVVLPAEVMRVFAAGAPAEVLLYTLVPEMLVGRNQMAHPAALEFVPPAYRAPVQIKNLPDRDDPRYDAELLALDPDVYVDYGSVDDDYVAASKRSAAEPAFPASFSTAR